MSPKLALFGEAPAFEEPLHVGRPHIGDRGKLLARIGDALDRAWLTNAGPFCTEFEARIADRLGVRHCIAVSNGTVGLEIAARALGLHGEVIVPSFTFIATAHALEWQGIRPIFCDVDPHTHNLDPACVEALITERTTGILGVHVWGRACAIDDLREIADRRGLRLFFDAAHAFGCTHRGEAIGRFGDAEVFSFHATKFVNTFEGGAVVTNDDEVAQSVANMRNFGFAGEDDVRTLGTNGKLSEIGAAMGLTSLEDLDAVVAVNQSNLSDYRRICRALPGLDLIAYRDGDENNAQYVVIEADEEQAGLSREDLIAALRAEGVLARRYFYPGCHRMQPYRSREHTPLPQTEALASRVLVLPTGRWVDTAKIERIGTLLDTALRNAGEVKAALGASRRPS